MKKYLILMLLIVLLPTVGALAAEPATEDIVKALESPFSVTTEAAQRIHDFQANFSQRSHIASINREQRGRGEVSFKFRDGSADGGGMVLFRWSYSEPEIQEIISNGRMMWVYLPENRQVIESDLSQVEDQGPNPVTFLSNLGNLARDFSITRATPGTDAEGNFRLRLVPHQASAQFTSMDVVVSQDAVLSARQGSGTLVFPLLKTVVTDSQGNSTAIEFDAVKINPGLPYQQFTFDRPADVEVVRAGEQLNFQ